MGRWWAKSRLVVKRQPRVRMVCPVVSPLQYTAEALASHQELRLKRSELAGYTSAIHPEGSCWAWSGRSSKLGIRQVSSGLSNENGETNGEAGRGPLGGAGKVVDTGKGKFGMDVKFVSYTLLSI
jgi:hypothetical protein